MFLQVTMQKSAKYVVQELILRKMRSLALSVPQAQQQARMVASVAENVRSLITPIFLEQSA